MPGAELDRLDLPPMTAVNEDRKGTAYTVTVDARDGVTTGISAADRARTIKLLADSATEPQRPHPPRPRRSRCARAEGGVLRRAGHTEAAVDLARLAGLQPAGALCEIVTRRRHDDARCPRLRVFADEHGLAHDLHRGPHRLPAPHRAARRAGRRDPLPTEHGEFRAVGYRARSTAPSTSRSCSATSATASRRAGARALRVPHRRRVRLAALRLRPAAARGLAMVAAEGRGVVLYLRGHEGRGIGLLHKLQAYQLQDAGATPSTPTSSSACPPTPATTAPARRSSPTSACARCACSPTTRPSARAWRATACTIIERVPLPSRPTPSNLSYLRTKRDRMGHDLPTLDDPHEAVRLPGELGGAL